MAFNATFFVLVFLPIALLGYYIVSHWMAAWARLFFLTMIGLLFYGKSQAYYVPLILVSASFNYIIGILLVRTINDTRYRSIFLTIGVTVDVVLLLYFKYFTEVFNAIAPAFTDAKPLVSIVTPLAVSFYTFQQIAFLVDVSRKHTAPGSFIEYLAFTTFFPQLLAGPISLHQEVAPQLARSPETGRIFANILIGLIIFSFGLFKKTVIADTFAIWADPYFDGAATGTQLGLIQVWNAALIYTLQIYFDFSGYSDMAIGVARMFGVVLPLNFFSPLRCRSIAELWQRWHMTLGRFVRIYIFQQLAIPLARLSARQRLGKWPALFVTTLLPTFLSMLIIGTWHGPNWTYVIFGAMHGFYMCVAEIFNFLTRKVRRKRPDSRLTVALFTGVTLAAFVLAEIPFRAQDAPTAYLMLASALGFHGLGFNGFEGIGVEDAFMLCFTAAAIVLCFLFPNTAQIMENFYPALDWERWRKVDRAFLPLHFKFNFAWFTIVAFTLFLGFVFITRGSQKFIYFNF